MIKGLDRPLDPGPPGSAQARSLALGVLLVVVLLLLFLVLLPMGALRARLGEDIQGYRDVLAVQGEIARRRVELGEAAKSLGDPRAMQDVLLAGNSDATAMAGLHERTRELVAAAKANLISIQQLPPGEEGGQRRIALRVQFASDLPGFQRIVYALESGRPAVIVTNLYLRARSARATGVANPLDVQMDLIAYRQDTPS
jgi:general secretion pathway protein M